MRSTLGLLAAMHLCGCVVEGGAYATAPAPAGTVAVSSGYAAQPAYAQPAAAQPAYMQPAYAQPAYGQPAVAQPAYAQPAYAQPAAAQPACVCRPGAAEICNGCDDNCNGVVDERCARY